jgi:hypothetical protein
MNKIKIVNQIFFWVFAVAFIVNIIPIALSLLTYIFPSFEITLNSLFEAQPWIYAFFQCVGIIFPIGIVSLIVLVYGLCLKLKNKNTYLLNISYALSIVAILIAGVVSTLKSGSQNAGVIFTLIFFACYLASVIIAIVVIVKGINKLQRGDIKDDFVLVPEKGEVGR